MKVIKLFFTLIAFSSLSTDACIWTKSSASFESPFYESNDIEVCFAPPSASEKYGIENPTDDLYREEYQKAMNTIKQTLENQINNRSSLNLINFGFCEGDSNPSSKRISFDLNSSEQIGAMSIVGPESGLTNMTSISMGIVKDVVIDKENPSSVVLPSELRDFSDKSHLSFVALHETLHSLGFHHEPLWGSDNFDPNIREVVEIGASMDEQSIMNNLGTKNYDENGLALLSETDVQCLDLVANKEILNLPSREIQRTQRVAPPTQAPSNGLLNSPSGTNLKTISQ